MANPGAVNSQSAVAQTLINSTQPPPVDMAQQAAQQNLQMVDAEGNAILVPAARYQEAVQTGAQLETNQQVAQRQMQEKYGDSGVRTFLESAASGATLGLSDQILAHFSDDKGYDLAARRAANTGSALAGEVAGTTGALLASGGIFGAVEGAARTALGAGRIAEGIAGAAEGAGALAKYGGLAARGAAEGAAMGVQKAVSENALGNPEDFGELLLSQVGMNALLGGALSPLADVAIAGAGKGLSKVGDATSSLVDNLKPFLPGATQTVDAVTGEAIGGTKAAIARKVNDIYASAMSLNPLNTVSKADLVTALNNPEGRALLGTQAMKDELEEFAKQAPTILADFKTNVTTANSAVRQELKDYTRTLAQGVKEDSAEAAAQLFKVRESIATAQAEAQQKLAAKLAEQTEPSKGLVTDVYEQMRKTVQKLGKDESVGKSYIQSINDSLETAFNAGADTHGAEIKALRQFRSELGEMAFNKQIGNLSVADRNATKELQSLYGQVNNILRDPNKVGSDVAKLLTVADSEYSKFAGLNKVFGDVTQRKVIQDTGQRTAVDSLAKASKNLLSDEQNARLVKVLGKAADIGDSQGQKIVKDDLVQGLKDLLSQKQTAAAVKEDVRDFLTSPSAKDYDALLAKAKELTGQTSAAQDNLAKLSGVKKDLTALGDAGNFDKALAVQKGTGAIDTATAQKLGTLKNLSQALGERESFLSSGAKEIADATRGHGEHGISLTGLAGKAVNPINYIRALDTVKEAVSKFQGEIVKSAVRAVVDASKPIAVRGVVLKVADYEAEKAKVDKMVQNIPAQLAGNGNPLLNAIPSEAAPSLLKTGGAAAQYLQQSLPQPPPPSMGPFGNVNKDWKPTAAQMQAYAEKKAVVENPKVAIDALADGSITKSQVEAIKAVYPRLYQQVSMSLMQLADKMQEGEGIAYSKNLAFAKWFGGNTSMTTSPGFMQRTQAAYSPQAQQNVDNHAQAAGVIKPTQAGLKNLNVSERAGTSLDKMAMRGNA